MGTAVLLIYIFIGILVYALSGTRTIAGQIESQIPLATFAQINGIVTFAAMALWPVWLVLYPMLKKKNN